MNRILISISCFFLALNGSTGYAGSAGHGSDGLKLMFSSARTKAVTLLQDSQFESKLPYDLDRQVKRWILDRRMELTEDIENTKYEWVKAEHQTLCGLTELKSQAPIQFSIETCRKTTHDIKTAMEVIVHESVHHFDIADEDFADQVAIAVIATDFDPDITRSGIWKTLPEDNLCISKKYLDPVSSVNLGEKIVFMTEVVVKAFPASQGGFAPDKKKNCGAILDLKTQTWSEVDFTGSQLYSPLGYYELVALDSDRVLVQGGQVYTLSTGTWKSLAPENYYPHYNMENPKIVKAGNKLYAIDQTHTVSVFDLNGPFWKPMRKVFGERNPDRRYETFFQIAASDRFVVILNRDSADWEVYDIEKEEWNTLSDMTPQKFAPLEQKAFFWDGESFIYFDGREGLRYFPLEGRKESIPRSPTAVRQAQYVWTGTEMFVFGMNSFNEVGGYLWNPKTRKWREISQTNSFRGYFHVVEIVRAGDRLIFWQPRIEGAEFRGTQFFPF